MNTVDRHLCWNTLKEDSLENAFYHTKDFVFLAIEIICIWKSELFLIFDQLFCEISTSILCNPSVTSSSCFHGKKKKVTFKEETI